MIANQKVQRNGLIKIAPAQGIAYAGMDGPELSDLLPYFLHGHVDSHRLLDCADGRLETPGQTVSPARNFPGREMAHAERQHAMAYQLQWRLDHWRGHDGTVYRSRLLLPSLASGSLHTLD